MLDSVLRLLHVGFLGPIINTSVFSEFSNRKLLVIQFFIRLCILSPGREEYRAEYHQHNSES